MEIQDINPWWKSRRLEEEYSKLPSRDLLGEISSYIEKKQIIAVHGLRRTGKTTLMHHIINLLLKTQKPDHIIYYSFDLLDAKVEEILDKAKGLLGIDIKKDRVFVFLDEIQKHDNWENELKALYDNYPNIKFFISGSSSLFIEKRTKESLGGRVFSFVLEPLTFQEYLDIKGIKIKGALFEKEAKEALTHYLRIGGFPELVDEKDHVKIDKYIKELIVDRIVYIDIPAAFEIDEPQLLERILSIISAVPGSIIDYESLADDLSRNRKTISNYIFYLEKAFLIKKLYNYSKNLLTTEKKSKRMYPASTAFAYLFNSEEGRIIETGILMNSSFKFFSRQGNKEVDFIKINKITLPIEAKYTDNVKDREIKGLLKFLDSHNLKEGVVITKSLESVKKIGDKEIRYIHLWKWLLEKS